MRNLERFVHTDVIDTASCPSDAAVTGIAEGVQSGIAQVGDDDPLGMTSFETRTGVVGHSEFVVPQTNVPVRELVAEVLSRPKPQVIVRQQSRSGPPPFRGLGHRKIKHRVSVPSIVHRRG